MSLVGGDVLAAGRADGADGADGAVACPSEAGAESTCWPAVLRPISAQNWSTVCLYASAATRPRRNTPVAARILSTAALCPCWSWSPKWQIGHTRYSFPP